MEGGLTPFGPDHKQILSHFFKIEILLFDTQNRIYLILRGLKNALSTQPFCDRETASSKEEW